MLTGQHPASDQVHHRPSVAASVGEAGHNKPSPLSMHPSVAAESEAPELVMPDPPAYAHHHPSGTPNTSMAPHMSAFLDLCDEPSTPPRRSFQHFVFRPLSAIGAKGKKLITGKDIGGEKA